MQKDLKFFHGDRMAKITDIIVRNRKECFLVLVSASMLVNILVEFTSSKTNLSNFNILTYYFLFNAFVQHYFNGVMGLAVLLYIAANIAVAWLVIKLLCGRARFVGWILLFLYLLTIVPVAGLREIPI
jgi:hypothetical protein